MGLELIILGLLRSPASGYELGSRLADDCSHFWSASLSQIYPLLARLERRGLLHSGLAPSRRGPQRRLYGLTDAGRARLAEILSTAPHQGVVRLPWLAEVSLAGAQQNASAVRQQLTRLHQQFEQQCQALQDDLDQLSTEPRTPDEAFERAARRCGLATAKARLTWCEETLLELEQVPWPTAGTRPPIASS